MCEHGQVIHRLQEFKKLLRLWSESMDPGEQADFRSAINTEKSWARRQVIEAHCFKTFTMSPPPAIGGLVLRNLDQFDLIFEAPYDFNVIPSLTDMIDETIGVLQNPPAEQPHQVNGPSMQDEVTLNYAFIAMPMDTSDPALEDVLDALKEGAGRCGVQAERVDEPDRNERITDRILGSIDKAQYVIVDLSYSKPNVYFEAGYAHGIGKIPIYVAREGTKL